MGSNGRGTRHCYSLYKLKLKKNNIYKDVKKKRKRNYRDRERMIPPYEESTDSEPRGKRKGSSRKRVPKKNKKKSLCYPTREHVLGFHSSPYPTVYDTTGVRLRHNMQKIWKKISKIMNHNTFYFILFFRLSLFILKKASYFHPNYVLLNFSSSLLINRVQYWCKVYHINYNNKNIHTFIYFFYIIIIITQ